LLNGEIDLKATRNALLPTATLTAQYSSVGLAGTPEIVHLCYCGWSPSG